MTEPIFLNSIQISDVLNIGIRDIPRYVRKYGMPAFQESSKGRWKARKETLAAWAVEHEKRFFKK